MASFLVPTELFEPVMACFQPRQVILVREETYRRNARIAGTLSHAALEGVVVFERT